MSIVMSLFVRFGFAGLCAIEFAEGLTIRIADEEWRLTREDSMLWSRKHASLERTRPQ